MTEQNNQLNEIQALDKNNEDNIDDNRNTDNSSNRSQFDLEEAMQLFCNGFGECAREAIRYLIEDEGLPANDPFVVGLKQHLVLQETHYLLQCLNNHRNDLLPTYEDFMQQRINEMDSGYGSTETSRPISPSNGLNDS